MQETPITAPCECGWTERAVIDEDVPITFKKDVGEYQLILKDGHAMLVLRHCAWCGGRLPESTRGELFTVPTEDEKADVVRRMQQISTSKQLIEALGEPSSRFHREWQTQYTYADTWNSLDLSVYEYDDGHLEFSVGGKLKDKDANRTQA